MTDITQADAVALKPVEAIIRAGLLNAKHLPGIPFTEVMEQLQPHLRTPPHPSADTPGQVNERLLDLLIRQHKWQTDKSFPDTTHSVNVAAYKESPLFQETEQAIASARQPVAAQGQDWLLYPDNMPKLYHGIYVSHPLLFATENEEGLFIRLGAYYSQPNGFIESGDDKRTVYTAFSVRSFYEYPFPPKGLSKPTTTGDAGESEV